MENKCLQNTSSTPQSKGTRVSVSFRDNDSFHNAIALIAAGNSVIVLGEAGTGKTDFAVALHDELLGEYQSEIATYKGSIKKFFIAIGFASARRGCGAIGNEGKEFVVTDDKGVYKTGAQIITSKVTTTVGETARTEIRNLTFNDEDAIAELEQLQRAYSGADIYIKGELTVDFPEDVRIPIEPNQMATAALSGSRIKFSYCSLERAIALLKDQYVVGTVEVRIVQT